MARIAILGGGTLGRALMAASWTAPFSPVVATRNPGIPTEVRVDVADAAALSGFLDSRGPFDLVIDTAAMTDVDACEKDPPAAQRTNAAAVRSLAAECGVRNIPLIYVSTNYVFSGTQKAPCAEDDPTGPCSIYGLTKLEGEWHALACAAPVAVVRTSWIFGGEKRDFVRHFLEKFRASGDIPVVSDQTASLTYAKDLAAGLGPVAESLMTAARAGKDLKRTYHVTNSGACTRYDMLLVMKETLKRPNPVQKVSREGFAGWQAVRPAYSVMSNARYDAEFGLPLRPWREALVEYLKGLPA